MHIVRIGADAAELRPAEEIGAKAANNDCELFEAKVTKELGSDSGRPDDPRAAFDALFQL